MINPDHHYQEKIDTKKYYGIKIKDYFTLFGKSRIPHKVETILERNLNQLVGKKILQYSLIQGDCDDGSGPGFFGLLLEDPSSKKKEWMIVTAAGSDKFLLLDNKWVGTSVLFYEIQKPLINNLSSNRQDNFGPVVDGSVIKKIELTDQKMVLQIEKSNEVHFLEVLNEDKRLPSIRMLPLEEQKKIDFLDMAIFPAGDRMGSYIIFMEEDGQLYV